MRTNEERITALHSRTAKLKKEAENRRFAAVCALSAAVCLAILAGLAFLIPRVSQNSFSGDAPGSMNASIFSDSGVSGYLVIAILAFLLGITVTVFCFRLKKYMDGKGPEDPR